MVDIEVYSNHSKDITVGKSYLVLLVLGRPKQWQRSSRVQRACSQKTPVIILENSHIEFFKHEENITQNMTAQVWSLFNYSTPLLFMRFSVVFVHELVILGFSRLMKLVIMHVFFFFNAKHLLGNWTIANLRSEN